MHAPRVSPCPNCGGGNLFRSRKPVSAGGGYAPNYLPGLGRFFAAGRFQLVVCRDCGLTRFFAQRDATERLGDSARWERA
jgi:predicted nucleic-acid-binding Zn-ribbon protein